MYFTEASQRERHTQVDAIREAALQMLAHNTVRAALPEVATRFSDRIERSVIPNLRNDTVQLPAAYRYTECLPIVTVPGHIALRFSKALRQMTELQRVTTLSWLQSHGYPPGKSEYLVGLVNVMATVVGRQQRTRALSPELAAFTKRDYVPVRLLKSGAEYGAQDMGIITRPVIVMDEVKTRDPVKASPLLVHELTHDMHSQKQTVMALTADWSQQLPDHSNREELEAYAIEYTFAQTLYDTPGIFQGDNRLFAATIAKEVEPIRRQYAVETDPFAPLPNLMAALTEAVGSLY